MATQKKTSTRTWKDNAEHYARDLDRRALSGLVKGILFVKGVSQKAVPVRGGNLRAGAFVTIDGRPLGGLPSFKGEDAGERSTEHAANVSTVTAQTARMSAPGKHAAAVGYSAIYALRVHENLNAGAAGYNAEIAGTKIRRRATKKLSKRRAEERHSKVGGGKFLENVVNSTRARVRQILKAEGQKARVK